MGWEGHRDGCTVPGNLNVGSVQAACFSAGEMVQNKAESLEESPQLSIPLPQTIRRSSTPASMQAEQEAKMNSASLSSPGHPGSC